ncbi:MAG: eukaryotic-like serine/threonine-protein kinase [Actinomycetota bacterium]
MAGEQATRGLVNGRYALRAVIGRGGVGQVWEAEDTVLGRAAAIKEVALPDRLNDDEREAVRARVMREARAAARLNHPRVVTVYDVVEDDNRLWLVMELVNGETLAERVRRAGPLTPHEGAAVGLQVLDALEHAHRQGVVHRDVKPSNVLVLPDGSVKLSDFGIASLTDDPRITSTGMVLGSPSYMAPEQATDGESGPATDMWGLGATIYYAVEGVGPFDRGEPLPTMHAVVHEDARPGVRTGALGEPIAALLAKDPAARPSATRTRTLLQASTAAPAVAVAPAPTVDATKVEDTPPAVRIAAARPRWFLPAVLVGLLVLLVGAAVLARATDRAATPASTGGSTATTAAPATQQTQRAPSGGTKTYIDPATGYRLAYPSGWQVVRPGGNRVDFRKPGSSTYLRVDWIKPPGASPVDAWKQQSASFRARYGDYRELAIASATYQGHRGARWEYSYSGQHAVNLGFVTDTYGFALDFQTAESEWSASQGLWRQLQRGFTPPAK